MNGRIETATDVLIVVDVAFCLRLAGNPGARDIVPVINRLVAGFEHVIVTQDWHPRGHISFASTHAGAKHLGVLD